MTETEFCSCDVTDFLAEGFTEIGVDAASVQARLSGRCIQCGTEGTTEWMTLGRIVERDERAFLPVDNDAVQALSQRSSNDEPDD
ncbi:hypothetical protein [Halopelagius fulvigenes]|uniref:DUF8134 domain-containing protein n=1 Tax=Halopelagius fulvigenes TaxID=1198324 RepID=A0ABD5TYA1_9EURY